MGTGEDPRPGPERERPGGATRREFLAEGGRAVAGLALLHRVRFEPPFDLVLKAGFVLDGTGGPGFEADLGLAGDEIRGVGSIAAEQGRRVVGVRGLHVSPGFVDVHSHSDGSILAYPTAESRVRQGITTEVTGNCGSSAAPLLGAPEEERRRDLEEEGIRADWNDVAAYFDRVERTGISVNLALLLGQGTLRRNAIGLADRPLTTDETRAALRAVEEGMDQGAFGLSTGLEYVPGRYTPAAEIVEMARVVARGGGLYASHIRNEEAGLLEAIDEAVEVGRRTGVRVEVSHLKAAGRPHWGKQRAALHLIESARREGVEVLADAYPYAAYSTGLSIFLPSWALEGGREATAARLRNEGERGRIRGEVVERVRSDPGEFDLVVLSRVRSEKNRSLVGKNLAEVAVLWGVEPADALLRLLEEERNSVSFVGHGMSEENVERVLAHPLVMIGSDGSSMAPTGKAGESRPHPRSYGTCARMLGRYCRERRLFDLEGAVRKMTSLPADQVGLRDRGRIARGRKADLVVFDAAKVADLATFEEPHRFPEGIVHVLVNGAFVVEGGAHTGARSGRVLRRA